MNDLGPFIRLELDDMKYAIIHHFSKYHEGISKIIETKLNDVCTEEYLEALIEIEIKKLVPSLISNVLNDFEIKEQMKNTILESMKPKSDEVVEDDSDE